MLSYVHCTTCRRLEMAKHFNETLDQCNKGCDLCQQKVSTQETDITEQAQQLLKVVTKAKSAAGHHISSTLQNINVNISYASSFKRIFGALLSKIYTKQTKKGQSGHRIIVHLPKVAERKKAAKEGTTKKSKSSVCLQKKTKKLNDAIIDNDEDSDENNGKGNNEDNNEDNNEGNDEVKGDVTDAINSKKGSIESFFKKSSVKDSPFIVLDESNSESDNEFSDILNTYRNTVNSDDEEIAIQEMAYLDHLFDDVVPGAPIMNDDHEYIHKQSSNANHTDVAHLTIEKEQTVPIDNNATTYSLSTKKRRLTIRSDQTSKEDNEEDLLMEHISDSDENRETLWKNEKRKKHVATSAVHITTPLQSATPQLVEETPQKWEHTRLVFFVLFAFCFFLRRDSFCDCLCMYMLSLGSPPSKQTLPEIANEKKNGNVGDEMTMITPNNTNTILNGIAPIVHDKQKEPNERSADLGSVETGEISTKKGQGAE
ncbi:protein kinase [Reticulomyxa filosa]|uniref:Protein kinase n=1 Tax=Reticulomyxa filosa TaxID=46433 RepID=X6MJU4_RETFI|nr:protein kinase [Reticulomyxa filosa]|eukprot:ETO14139.1 protein kinase [Reticulomyxa filosa]